MASRETGGVYYKLRLFNGGLIVTSAVDIYSVHNQLDFEAGNYFNHRKGAQLFLESLKAPAIVEVRYA